MKSWKWIVFIFFFMGWVIHPGPSDLQAARTDLIEKDITQKKKDLKDVKKEISSVREKEKKIQGKEISILESLDTMDTELYKKKMDLKKMETRLEQIKEKLHQTENQVTDLNKGMERTKEELLSRLIALYKMKRVPPETFLLTSQSYLDLLKMDTFLKVIIHFDAQLINTYHYQVVLKSRYQEELTQDRLQCESYIYEVEQKKQEIKKVQKQKKALLKSIQNQKSVYQKVIEELEGRAEDLQGLIKKLEHEKSLLAYGKLKFEALKGKLIPPIRGKVISLFKEKGQNGIEIQAPMGTEIQAVLPGKVLYADSFKGFGKVVIIDHGDHIFTTYGYGSELLTKEGDTVFQGETIARVGSAGSLKGPCLYFEIRYQGKPQDPMQWISPLDRVVFLPEGNEKGKK